MMKSFAIVWMLLASIGISPAAWAALQDQGLNSILEIIDKAIAELEVATGGDGEIDPAVLQNATDTVVNLSRTLGTLSFSRLQCGEAGVLAEFTQRVQLMPEESRDPMRDAFQEGFDKSKEETPLLSRDECDRLTRSRTRAGSAAEGQTAAAAEPGAAEPEEPKPDEDEPRLRLMRIAELSGQLAYKRRFCESETVFNRDYNEFLEKVPEEFREQAKAAYWQGYQRGKKLNKYLTRESCAG